MYYFNYDTFVFQSLIYFSHIPVNFALLAEELVQHKPLKEWHHTHLNMMHAAHRQKNFAAREFVRGGDLGVSASDQHDVNFGQSFWKMFDIFYQTVSPIEPEACVQLCACVCVCACYLDSHIVSAGWEFTFQWTLPHVFPPKQSLSSVCATGMCARVHVVDEGAACDPARISHKEVDWWLTLAIVF